MRTPSKRTPAPGEEAGAEKREMICCTSRYPDTSPQSPVQGEATSHTLVVASKIAPFPVIAPQVGSERELESAMRIRKLVVWFRALPDGKLDHATGRTAWALLQLIGAGLRGCTSQNTPAPRWAAYVHKLQRKRRLQVLTIREHGGPFAGRHARYILAAPVTVGSTCAEVVSKGYDGSATSLTASRTEQSHPAPARSVVTGAPNERH
jgi:hypothetical protein